MKTRDQLVIEKLKELIDKQDIFISYFRKYSERITRFSAEIGITRTELSALESSEPEERTAEEILEKYTGKKPGYFSVDVIKAMHEFAELRQGEVKHTHPECGPCGQQNSENCNTCDVLNPQFR